MPQKESKPQPHATPFSTQGNPRPATNPRTPEPVAPAIAEGAKESTRPANANPKGGS